MNELEIFKNEDFGEVRTVLVNGEPMFFLADVCRILDISNSRNVKERLNQKGVCSMDTLGKRHIRSMNYRTAQFCRVLC